MPLPVFKTKDEIPEAFRSEYMEKDGQWVPNLEDVTGIKANARKVLDEKKKLEDQLNAALGGRKLEDVADLLRKQQELEEAQARKAGDFDKLLEKRVNETKAEYDKQIAALSPFKQKYEDRELEGIIRKAAIPAGVDPRDLEEYVIPLVKGRRIRLDGDKVVVLDRDGDPTGLSPEKFFTDAFKTEAPKFYQAAGGSGGGSAGASGSGSKVVAGTIARTDTNALLANLDKVAKGEVKVA
jgi:hypothetical protein